MRFARASSMHRLDDFLVEWERWSAELLESTISFRVLALLSSQHDNQFVAGRHYRRARHLRRSACRRKMVPTNTRSESLSPLPARHRRHLPHLERSSHPIAEDRLGDTAPAPA